ncbi:hypothetical protein [Pseudonocardia adelaidensis]|uniref:hypothetical protein n=1 Tax=Pseudonocardia adelaidensis TaxID=648754 RepID=UPI0031E76F14
MGSLVVVAAAAGAVLTTNVAVAAEPATAVAVSARSLDHQKPLLELATADSKGSFYTLDPAEADRAQREHGFTPKYDSTGITMFDEQVDGSIPVYRLRQKDAFQTYLLSVSEDEIDGLGDRFVNEGVVGYVWSGERDGAMALVRYSKDSDWRVAREGRLDLKLAGFTADGVMGYVPEG